MIQSSTAYRQLGMRTRRLGAVDSLENIVSSPLPNGAECWVVEDAAVYRFDKESSETADGEQIIAPIAGGGRWYRMPFSPSTIAATSVKFGAITANTSGGGIRIVGAIVRNVPSGQSFLAQGTFSCQPPTVAGASIFIGYQSSANMTFQTVARSAFFEDTATRRSFACAGFVGPFNQDLSWIYVRVVFESLVATAVPIVFPQDQASIVLMTLPPLPKV